MGWGKLSGIGKDVEKAVSLGLWQVSPRALVASGD